MIESSHIESTLTECCMTKFYFYVQINLNTSNKQDKKSAFKINAVKTKFTKITKIKRKNHETV